LPRLTVETVKPLVLGRQRSIFYGLGWILPRNRLNRTMNRVTCSLLPPPSRQLRRTGRGAAVRPRLPPPSSVTKQRRQQLMGPGFGRWRGSRSPPLLRRGSRGVLGVGRPRLPPRSPLSQQRRWQRLVGPGPLLPLQLDARSAGAVGPGSLLLAVLGTLGRQICASGSTAAARDPGPCTVQIQAHAGFFFCFVYFNGFMEAGKSNRLC
jgi:hypothetical protein